MDIFYGNVSYLMVFHPVDASIFEPFHEVPLPEASYIEGLTWNPGEAVQDSGLGKIGGNHLRESL